MTGKASLALIVALQTIVATAYAGDAATVSTAREVAKQGLSDYDAGRFEEAAQKLSKAYAVVHVPTLALATARALAKSGKLVAASELYLEAQRIPRDKSWQASQEDAQRDAEKERAELLGRIPRLSIVVEGAELAAVAIRIDGAAVPQALSDTEQMVDPGERQVEGTLGNQVVKRAVQVKEGEHARVTLTFEQTGAAAGASAATDQTKPANTSSTPSDAASKPPAPRGGAQRTLGWTTVGVGGVGLIVGTVTGLVAMSKRSSMLDSDNCAKDNVSCSASQSSSVDSYNSMRTVSTIGFIAGGVLTAAGVTLLLTAPKQESKPSVALWLSPSGAGIYGGF